MAAAAAHRIAWAVSLPAGAVQVQVDDGWITLTGQLGRHYQQQAVEREVYGMTGVIGVFNETTMKPASEAGDNKASIMHALNRSWPADPDGLGVAVDGGKVRLTGSVRSPRNRDLAASIAWTAFGTTAVENDFRIS